MSHVIKTFSLDTKTDSLLLQQLAGLERGELSPIVRDALKVYFEIANGVTHHMLYKKMCEIERKLDSGAVVSGAQGDDVVSGAQGDDVPDFLMELGT